MNLQRGVVAALIVGAVAAGCSADRTEEASPSAGGVDSVNAAAAAAAKGGRAAWRKDMARNPLPKEGCFRAAYPATAWEEVACTTSPDGPSLPSERPRNGLGHQGPGAIVGGGGSNDYMASQNGAIISWSEGSFPIVNNVTSETDSKTGNSDDYALQLNTNTFSGVPLCNGRPGCQGWQQFIYRRGKIYIEYWLLNYGSSCPSGWLWYSVQNGSCRIDSINVNTVPDQPITNLGGMILTASAGATDAIHLWLGDGSLYALSAASVLNLSQGWTQSEFNVFGEGNSSQANFNPGATIVVQTLTSNGVPGSGSYQQKSTTGETNNLTLVPNSVCQIGGPAPGIRFTESNVPGATASGCPLPATPVSGGEVAASQQFGVPQTDLFTIDNAGELTVSWAFGGEPWSVPAVLSPGWFPPGAPLVATQQFGLTQTDVVAIDNGGNFSVAWTSPSGWAGPTTVLPWWFNGNFVPGSHLAASQQFGTYYPQTDVFVVDKWGALTVSWVVGGGSWNSQEISPQWLFPPGAPLVATQQFGVNRTVVLLVDNWGAMEVMWADGGGAWQGPARLTPTGWFPPGASVAASQQFGIQQTDLMVVNNSGDINVMWAVGGGAWQGPAVITSGGQYLPGAPLAMSQQFGSTQTDLFAVNRWGGLTAMWATGGGAWQGPIAIGSAQFGSKTPLAASAQFGLWGQTDVFAINTSSVRTAAWVDNTYVWTGPGGIE